MNVSDDLGLRQRQQVIIATYIAAIVSKSLTPIAHLIEAMPLDHRAHRAIDNQNALFDRSTQLTNPLVAGALVERLDRKRRSGGSGIQCTGVRDLVARCGMRLATARHRGTHAAPVTGRRPKA